LVQHAGSQRAQRKELLNEIAMKKISTLSLIALSLLALPLSGLAADAPAAAAKPSLTVQAVQPQAAQWPQLLSATGSLAAWQEVVIGAEIGGQRIQQVLVNVGDRVKKGQLLVRLSPGTLEADLAAARASLAEAEVSARDAQAQAERAKPLRKSEALAAQQIDSLIAAADMAQARVASLRARLQADELRLAYTRITAPDDGVITARDAVEGALAQPGAELLRLQRGGRLEWRAEVPATDLAQLKAGQAVRIQPSGAAAVTGKVRTVSPRVDPQTRNGLVYVDVQAGSELRAGLFARGDFVLGEKPVLTLPQTAVLLRDGFSYVFQIEKDKVRQLKVVVGRRQGDRVEIRGGLSAGKAVVASGVGFLGDGDTVRLAPAAAK
jgi:RND family efflux transporter MFP subunit